MKISEKYNFSKTVTVKSDIFRYFPYYTIPLCFFDKINIVYILILLRKGNNQKKSLLSHSVCRSLIREIILLNY